MLFCFRRANPLGETIFNKKRPLFDGQPHWEKPLKKVGEPVGINNFRTSTFFMGEPIGRNHCQPSFLWWANPLRETIFKNQYVVDGKPIWRHHENTHTFVWRVNPLGETLFKGRTAFRRANPLGETNFKHQPSYMFECIQVLCYGWTLPHLFSENVVIRIFSQILRDSQKKKYARYLTILHWTSLCAGALKHHLLFSIPRPLWGSSPNPVHPWHIFR